MIYKLNKRTIILITILVSIVNICIGQNCNTIERLYKEKGVKQSNLKDSLLTALKIKNDTNLIRNYEECLISNIGLLDEDNIGGVTYFYGYINLNYRTFGHRYNQQLLKLIWNHVTDTSKPMRDALYSFMGIHTDYVSELFSSNPDVRNQLKILLQKYPSEYRYIGEIRKYKFNELIHLLKSKMIINNKGENRFAKDQKWGALITCYSIGDNTVFPLIDDFIDKEKDVFVKYQHYEYILGLFNSKNEKKLLLKVLKRKDILTNMPEAERTDIVVDNYFTAFIMDKVVLQYKDFKINIDCAKQNEFNKSTNQQEYYGFKKRCLYSETIKWFKNKKLIK